MFGPRRDCMTTAEWQSLISRDAELIISPDIFVASTAQPNIFSIEAGKHVSYFFTTM